jgi:hypothetical protein
MSLTLRPYQNGAIQGIYNYFLEASGNPLVVIPTAGGKSLVMATFVEGVLKAYQLIPADLRPKSLGVGLRANMESANLPEQRGNYQDFRDPLGTANQWHYY